MGIFDVILGRTKPTKSKRDALLAITTAEVTLQSRYNCISTGKAAISFKAAESSFFANLNKEIEDLLRISIKSTRSTFDIKQDTYGYTWVVLNDSDFDDLASLVQMIGESIADKGYDSTLLASVFEFKCDSQTVYWVYNYKRGKFYPFVPLAGNMQRDNATELRMKTWLEKELPVEKALEQWYGLWGMPLS